MPKGATAARSRITATAGQMSRVIARGLRKRGLRRAATPPIQVPVCAKALGIMIAKAAMAMDRTTCGVRFTSRIQTMIPFASTEMVTAWVANNIECFMDLRPR